MGNEANSPAAQTASFLIHFLPSTSGSATCGRRRSTHPWCDFRHATHAMLKHIKVQQSGAAFDLGFESAFELAFDSAFDSAFD
ncbi:hypothetical protein [Undibacterium sp.]|uniref:hypothetical protein n=1 Tax=Undibacterium sp. TaxID=1914977 RepID=UPI0025E9AB02|nr:hypothetical protein [Undibacterium sp.]